MAQHKVYGAAAASPESRRGYSGKCALPNHHQCRYLTPYFRQLFVSMYISHGAEDTGAAAKALEGVGDGPLPDGHHGGFPATTGTTYSGLEVRVKGTDSGDELARHQGPNRGAGERRGGVSAAASASSTFPVEGWRF